MEEQRFLASCKMIFFLIFLISSLNLLEPRFAAAQEDECQPTRCHPSGPIIRFPFRLKNRQPEHCGYSGFDLTCSSTNGTEFEFQFPVRASARNIILPVSARATVKEIDYGAQAVRLTVLNGSCLPARVPAFNATPSPFEMYYPNRWESPGFTLFNCSSRPGGSLSSGPITCLGNRLYQVYAIPSYYSFSDVSISNCVKMFNISDISEVIFNGPGQNVVTDTYLHWPEPFCGDCERIGVLCRLRSNGTIKETECVERPKEPQHVKKGVSRNVAIAVTVVGVCLTALAVGSLYKVYIMKKRKQDKSEKSSTVH